MKQLALNLFNRILVLVIGLSMGLLVGALALVSGLVFVVVVFNLGLIGGILIGVPTLGLTVYLATTACEILEESIKGPETAQAPQSPAA